MQTPPHPGTPAPGHAYTPAPADPSNGLAIAAFVISLVGLLGTGGLLCPIGLILGLVALGKPGGRGFAIAAIILGLVGSCGVFIVTGIAIIFGIGLLVAFFAFAIGAAGSAENVGVAVDMATVAAEVSEYRQRTGGYPDRLEDLSVDPGHLVDPWGGRLVYEPTGEQLGFDLVSAGPDGTPGTDDDIRLSQLGALFGFPGARIEVEGGAGSGGITRITAGELQITVDPGPDGGAGRVLVKRGDMTVFEATDSEFRMGSDLGSDEAAPTPAPPPAPAPAPAPARARPRTPHCRAAPAKTSRLAATTAPETSIGHDGPGVNATRRRGAARSHGDGPAPHAPRRPHPPVPQMKSPRREAFRRRGTWVRVGLDRPTGSGGSGWSDGSPLRRGIAGARPTDSPKLGSFRHKSRPDSAAAPHPSTELAVESGVATSDVTRSSSAPSGARPSSMTAGSGPTASCARPAPRSTSPPAPSIRRETPPSAARPDDSWPARGASRPAAPWHASVRPRRPRHFRRLQWRFQRLDVAPIAAGG